MSGIITLGIGPKSTIKQFLLYGLGGEGEEAEEEEAIVGAGAAAEKIKLPSLWLAAEAKAMMRPRAVVNPSPTRKAESVLPPAPKLKRKARPAPLSLDRQIENGLAAGGELDPRSFARTVKSALKETGLPSDDPRVGRLLKIASQGDAGRAFASLSALVQSAGRERDLEARKEAAIETRAQEKVEHERLQAEGAKAAQAQELERQKQVEYAKEQRQAEKAQAIEAQRELMAQAKADKAAAMEARESEREMLKQLRKELRK